MTIGTRWAPDGLQRAQRPCFLFGAKEASAGEEYRGIKQRFTYRCNKTKTSRTAGRRSPWSPRRRHHQSLWQAKTTFVRISCTRCPLSNWPLLAPFPLNIWGEDQCSDPASNGQVSVLQCHPWIGNADTHSTRRIYNRVAIAHLLN